MEALMVNVFGDWKLLGSQQIPYLMFSRMKYSGSLKQKDSVMGTLLSPS